MKHSAINTLDQFSHGAALRLFQDSVDPIILTDLSGMIIEANERSSELFGFTREELVSNSINKLHQDGQVLPDFTQLPDGSLQVFDSLMPVKGNRKLLHVQVHARRYTLDAHDMVQWIHHDFTRQVELDKLRQDLAAMLVHDLQSPLGNVISSLELVTGELPPDSSPILLTLLDVAVRSSHHLQTLVDSLLNISQLEAGYPLTNREPVNVEPLIDFIYAVAEPDLEQRGVTLLRHVGTDVPDVLAEEGMLRRVLLNLVNNALKHSRHGQTVTIKTRKMAVEEMVLFSVIDQGVGVPEQHRERIFEKFQQVRTGSSSNGLGLGLAFCRLAVEAHGGRIWVEAAASGGACFCFTVPAVPDEKHTSTATPGG